MHVAVNGENTEPVRRVLEKMTIWFCCSFRREIHFVFGSIPVSFCRWKSIESAR